MDNHFLSSNYPLYIINYPLDSEDKKLFDKIGEVVLQSKEKKEITSISGLI
jgi:hypothetical protein